MPRLQHGLACIVFLAGFGAAVAADAPEEAGRHVPPGVPQKYIHFSNPAAGVGDAAPELSLGAADGGARWVLARHRGGPVALVFGSLTDPRLRTQAAELERLRVEFDGRAEFVLVYIREAHALDEWMIDANEEDGIRLMQPATDSERAEAARACAARLGVRMPVAVDGVDDAAMKAYGAWPGRLFLVDGAGKIAYRGRPGPAGFRPDELRAAITALVPAAPVPAGASPAAPEP